MKHITKGVLILFSILLSGGLQAQTQTIQKRVNASADDAEERGANATSNVGGIDLTSSDLELTNDGSTGDQYIGMRFTSLAIPQGALITNAYIQFTVDETANTSGSVTFRAQNADNSSAFTSTAFNISSRPTTAASVVWSNIPNWTVAGTAGPDQRTPDLTSIVQAVVNRGGWASGNALTIIATGTGKRTAESYDGSNSQAPLLVVEFIAPVTSTFNVSSGSDDAEQDVANGSMDISSSDLEITKDGTSEQLIGMRFNNVSIPAGSQIVNAYIQFTVDEVTTSGTVNAVFGVEDQANALPISSASYNLQLRTPYLGDTTIWNVPPFSTIDNATTNERTPDLSNLVNRVVGKPAWASGNAMVILMADPALLSISGYTGNTGKRTARSYESGSTKAPKLIVTYIPPVTYQNGTFPVAKNSSWKYNDLGVALPSTWVNLNYNDTNWAFGPGILGYDNPNIATTLSFGPDGTNKYTTTYLRHIFNVADASAYDSLVFSVLRDDGVVVYVNGVEAFRHNMPAGTVSFSTLASSAVGGADESAYFRKVTANLLQNGTNVIAVELHQAAATSSDLSFDMEVTAKLPPLGSASYPFPKFSNWHYLDNGSDLGLVAWKDTTYNDNNWAWGKAPLGYGDPMNTTISFGPSSSNKYITSYFRRDIEIDLATLPDTLNFGLRRDDGAVIYVNGVEIIRSNMPAGAITYTTFSSTTVDGSNETTYFSHLLPKTVFKNGRNTIAVEVHNRSASSSDIGFDLFVEAAPVVNPPALGCSNGNAAHIACFTSIAPTAQTSTMLIPTASHKFQMIFKQGEAYTKGGGNVPGNHDYTAYVGLNGSSTMGHVAVNHETTPGAVSMLDVHYNDSTKLWVVDTTQAINFNATDIVGTSRNCSGGITPWGTVVTAEETTSSGDANSDGYQDMGWFVEIDPLTNKVLDYDNDGKQDKLWAMGRMSHENIVVTNDGTKAFYGEDGGTQCVYKYVMTTPGNLSSGTVYVLKLDQPLVGNDPSGTTATWVMVPNTTQSDRNNLNTVAASLGGTNFNGVEDVEISPIDGKIYFASKGFGRVYRFTENGSGVTNFETFVGGKDYILNTEQGVFTEPWGSGNDNLIFDNNGNLWVQQDGGRNYMWVVRPDHSQSAPKVELFASMPSGSEPTGLTFTPDYKFGFFSVQHPSSSNVNQMDASGNNVRFNASATVVFSREAWLGAQAPKAGFMADTMVVIQGGTVNYTDTSANYPTSRQWMFDGGTPATSTSKNPAVTYNTVGQYNAKLVVANQEGSDSATYQQYIQVIACPNPMNTTMKADGLKAFWGLNDPYTYYFGVTQWKRISVTRTGGVGPFTYTWNKIGTGTLKAGNTPNSIQLFEPTSATKVYVTIYDAGTGCTTTDTVTIAFDNSYFCGSTSPKMDYKLYVCVNGNTQCVTWNMAKSLLQSNSATIGACTSKTEVNTSVNVSAINVYPNPTTGFATLAFEADVETTGTLSIIDVNGKVVMQSTVQLQTGTTQHDINITGLPQGTYIVRLVTEFNVYTERLQLLKK
jgi:secreted PhoX family phosphatase